MNRIIAAPIVAVPLLLLAACNSDEMRAPEGEAGGEVVEGTISDAMIPLADTTSQPPLEEGGGNANSGGGQDSDGAADTAPAPSAQPAAESAPAAQPDAPAEADAPVDALEAAE